MSIYRISKTMIGTATASVLIRADNRVAAEKVAESTPLGAMPWVEMPLASTDLEADWTFDLDDNLDVEEIEGEDIEPVKPGDPYAECSEPIESADQIADGRPLCADHFAHWNNMTA